MSENLKDEDIYYVFLNTKDPIHKHNFNISKKLTSATLNRIIYEQNEDLLYKYWDGTLKYSPFHYCDSDLIMLSEYGNKVTKDFFREYVGEYIREEKYSNKKPSRFSCLFAFKDKKSIDTVIEQHNWDKSELKKFKIIPNKLNRIAKVNMSIASNLIGLYSNLNINNSIGEELWRAYWDGLEKIPYDFADKFNLGHELIDQINAVPTVWEYLIEGELTLVEE